jgi:hypothetical protein
MSDLDWLRKKCNATEQKIIEALHKAKAEAIKSGKEPFRFEALKEYYDPSSDLGYDIQDPKMTAETLERRYYLEFPKVKSLRDFVARLTHERTYR